MGTSISLKKKVYVCYYYSNNMDIELLRKKINKEGFQAITGRNEIMPGERILSVSESITKCDYFVLIISDEFSQYMREEYNTALKYEKSVMVFIKSELYGDGEINKEFKDRLVTLWDNETELSMKIIETMVGLRYKYPVRGYQLEVLVEDLFKFYGCNGSDENAKKAIKGTLRENGKLILNLSNRDLSNMLEYELNGNLASEYLYNVLDEMLIELEK